MDLYQFIIFIVTFIITFFAFITSIIGMFWWNRTSIDALKDAIDANDKNLRNVIDENARETRSLINAIQQEIKDFHGRLCAIEERRKR
jgi:hypothetical protein